MGFTTALFNNLFGCFDTAVGGVTATNGQQFGNARAFVLHTAFGGVAGIGCCGGRDCSSGSFRIGGNLIFIHVSVSFFRGWVYRVFNKWFRRPADTYCRVCRNGYKTDFIRHPTGNDVTVVLIVCIGIVQYHVFHAVADADMAQDAVLHVLEFFRRFRPVAKAYQGAAALVGINPSPFDDADLVVPVVIEQHRAAVIQAAQVNGTRRMT